MSECNGEQFGHMLASLVETQESRGSVISSGISIVPQQLEIRTQDSRLQGLCPWAARTTPTMPSGGNVAYDL